MSLVYQPQPHRYFLDDKRVPSVTTIIAAGIPKGDGLSRWYARTVAEHVVANLREVDDTVTQLGDAGSIAWLSDLPNQAAKIARERGTAVHALAVDIIKGEPVQVDDPALLPYVEGYTAWLDAFDVEPLGVEVNVARRGVRPYAGRFDLYARIGDDRWLLDLKTSRGVYGETAVQLGGYARADFWADDEHPDVEHDMPPIDRIGVVHVTPDGTYLYDMGDADAAAAEFDAAYVTYQGVARRRTLGRVPFASAVVTV